MNYLFRQVDLNRNVGIYSPAGRLICMVFCFLFWFNNYVSRAHRGILESTLGMPVPAFWQLLPVIIEKVVHEYTLYWIFRVARLSGKRCPKL